MSQVFPIIEPESLRMERTLSTPVYGSCNICNKNFLLETDKKYIECGHICHQDCSNKCLSVCGVECKCQLPDQGKKGSQVGFHVKSTVPLPKSGIMLTCCKKYVENVKDFINGVITQAQAKGKIVIENGKRKYELLCTICGRELHEKDLQSFSSTVNIKEQIKNKLVNKCAKCTQPITIDDLLLGTPCEHYFHLNCAYELVANSATQCPQCSLPLENLEPNYYKLKKYLQKCCMSCFNFKNMVSIFGCKHCQCVDCTNKLLCSSTAKSPITCGICLQNSMLGKLCEYIMPF